MSPSTCGDIIKLSNKLKDIPFKMTQNRKSSNLHIGNDGIIFFSLLDVALKFWYDSLSWMVSDFGNHLLYNQHYMNQYQWGSDSGDPDPQGAYITFKGLQFGLLVRGKKNHFLPFFKFLSNVCFVFLLQDILNYLL